VLPHQCEATSAPSAAPIAAPTASPTASPAASPTAAPTASPTAAPTAAPTSAPTAAPTLHHCIAGTHYCWRNNHTEVPALANASCVASTGDDYTCECPAGMPQTLAHISHQLSSDNATGGSIAAALRHQCAKCNAGFYPSQGSELAEELCAQCAAGHFSLLGALSCDKCELGKFQSLTASDACSDCPSGYHTAGAAGAVACDACEVGRFSIAGVVSAQMANTSQCDACHITCRNCLGASANECSSCPTTGTNAGSFLNEGEASGMGVCVPNTSSVVKTGLVLNGLNMSSFNNTDQLKQIVIGAVVAALSVDASSVFVDSIGEISDTVNASSTRRQLATTGIRAVIRIVTDTSQADTIGAGLKQIVSDGALLESMATEAESMGLGATLSTTLREATVEMTAPPTVTGESGVPRLAEPPTTSPTPAPGAEEPEDGLSKYLIMLPVIGGVLLVLVLLCAKLIRNPKSDLNTKGKQPAKKKKQSVAMVVPTADDTPELPSPSDTPELPSPSELPLPKSSALPVLSHCREVVPALAKNEKEKEDEKEARMQNHTTSRHTNRFGNPTMGEDDGDWGTPDSPGAVLGPPPKWLLAQISDDEAPWS
jgi:hypothetical protein